jgi:hypothetical protein
MFLRRLMVFVLLACSGALCCWAEDIFAPTMVSIDMSSSTRAVSRYSASRRAYRSSTSASSARSYSVLPTINSSNLFQRKKTTAVATAFGGNSYSSMGVTHTSSAATSSVTEPFSTSGVGSVSVPVGGISGPAMAPSGDPIGQLTPLTDEIWTFSALLVLYFAVTMVRRRKRAAQEK